jgi:hypothetical protein
MVKKILKELVVYLLILVILALFWHPDLMDNPAERLDRLLAGANRLSHPLEWSMVVYILFGIVRLAIFYLKKLFCKVKSSKEDKNDEKEEIS